MCQGGWLLTVVWGSDLPGELWPRLGAPHCQKSTTPTRGKGTVLATCLPAKQEKGFEGLQSQQNRGCSWNSRKTLHSSPGFKTQSKTIHLFAFSGLVSPSSLPPPSLLKLSDDGLSEMFPTDLTPEDLPSGASFPASFLPTLFLFLCTAFNTSVLCFPCWCKAFSLLASYWHWRS